MNSLKALSKQLFGARYERVGKSLLICLILFVSLYAAGIQLVIAPFILFLTSAIFTAGVTWQTLNAAHNTEMLQGFFLLPFGNRGFTMSIALAFSGYTLITKTALVWMIFFAVSKWSVLQMAAALLCGCNACFATTAIYALSKNKKWALAVLWAIAILGVVFGVRNTAAVLVITTVSLGTAIGYLLAASPYTFYCPHYSHVVRRVNGKSGVFTYLLRYLLSNRSYLVNTLGLTVIACFLPLLFGQFEGINIFPLGLAILCLNTPICVLLSCDPDLEQAIRTLPGQASRFCNRYLVFIFAVNGAIGVIYLCSWQLINGNISGLDCLTVALFALQSAILSVLLEWLWPIRNWKIESDLWHHPRKYIVPLLMMLLAAFIGTWTPLIMIWLCVLVLECVGLLLIARRI